MLPGHKSNSLFNDPVRFVRAVIYLNGAIYVLSLLLNRGGVAQGFQPLNFLSPQSKSLLLLGATGTFPIRHLGWWTLISANFLHGNLLHLFFNMAALSQIGPLTIREYGVYRTSVIYLVGGVVGFWISYLAGVAITIGASASLCSLIGALLYFGKHRGGLYGRRMFRQVGGWVIGLVLFGLAIPNINNWGHGGGIVAGIFLGWVLGYEERLRERRFHYLLGMFCMAVAMLVMAWAILTAFWFRLTG